MTDYQKTAENALRMIASKGRAIAFSYMSEEHVYDPATDTFTEGEAYSKEVKGVFTGFATKDIDGEIIRRSDKRVLVAAASLKDLPLPEGALTDGNESYIIINTEVLQPGDTPLLYMIQVRR